MISQLKLSKQEIEAAREWLLDCYWENMEEEDIQELSNVEIEKAVSKYYEGGIDAFKLEALYLD